MASSEKFPAGTPMFKKSAEEVRKDLELLVDRALELGATRAALIEVDKVVVDDRVPYKCRYPPCPSYGRLLMCPPHTMTPDETRSLLKNYECALLIRVEAEPGLVLGEEAIERKEYRTLYQMPLDEVLRRLEGEAFYRGYYFALGFKSGPCLLCGFEVKEKEGVMPDTLPCPGLKTGICKYPLKTRPSLEAIGIDVYATASNAGWPIYVLGYRSDPHQVPCLGFHALLLIY